ERDGLDVESEVADRDVSLGREPVAVDRLVGVDGVRRGHLFARLHVPEADVDVGDADVGAVEPRAVLEPSCRPAPTELPPVTHAPRVVALTVPVEIDALVADEELAGAAARDLVAGRGRGVGRGALGLPLEVEAE